MLPPGRLRLPSGESAEQTGQQRNQSDSDECDTAACHQLLHSLGLGAGIVIPVPFHQVDRAPDT